MDKDLEELLSALNGHGVRYVVVGGYAVGVHAQPRVTKDLNVFIDASDANAKAVYAALASFGAPMEELSAKDFQRIYSVVRIGVPPIAVDILQQIDGVSFEQVWTHSAEFEVDGEVSARYLSADDLIENKLASGRPQDLADVEAIRQARVAQQRESKGIA